MSSFWVGNRLWSPCLRTNIIFIIRYLEWILPFVDYSRILVFLNAIIKGIFIYLSHIFLIDPWYNVQIFRSPWCIFLYFRFVLFILLITFSKKSAKETSQLVGSSFFWIVYSLIFRLLFFCKVRSSILFTDIRRILVKFLKGVRSLVWWTRGVQSWSLKKIFCVILLSYLTFIISTSFSLHFWWLLSVHFLFEL